MRSPQDLDTGGPRRPEVENTFTERTRARVTEWPWRESAPMLATAIVGLSLVVAGGFWGWSAWSQRSSVPIDDQLPFLVDQAGEPDAGQSGRAQSESGESGYSSESAQVSESAPLDGDSAAVGSETVPLDTAAGAAAIQTPMSTPQPTAIVVWVVHVSGAVNAPGVVEIAGDGRVHQAVAAAGGPREDADLDRVNLAAPLVDGERIHIPAIGEDEPPELVMPDRPAPIGSNGASSQIGAQSAPTPTPTPQIIDLNRATVAELELLPGVGPTIARAIAALREARGPYYSVDELLQVDGIGPAKLEALRSHAWVQGGTTSS